MKLIMLCGQGNTGKSTYGEWLKMQLKNSILIKMDDFVEKQKKFNETYLYQYIDKISESLKKDYDNVIIDFSQDSNQIRATILENIDSDFNNIDFYTISLRPSENKVLEWTLKRCNTYRRNESQFENLNQIFSTEYIENLKQIYKGFNYPTPEEFYKYNFKSTTHIILDNSKPYERLFW